MKIVFTGGDSGGHFYPIMAVARELRIKLNEAGVDDQEFYLMSNDPYDQEELDKNNIVYLKNPTGKNRLYFSVKNFSDVLKTFGAVLRALMVLYKIFPDVIFSKGGFSSVPVTLAARFYGIPVIIHESDSVPGRANVLASAFAEKIATSYPKSVKFFPKDKVALTGNPIRHELLAPIEQDSHELLGLQKDTPVIFIVGGSQGAQTINDIMLIVAPMLLEKYQIVHQVGEKNLESFRLTLDVAIVESQYKYRYHVAPYLNTLQMRHILEIVDLVISRGGSTIFEIAAHGKPSIVVPINVSNGDHQRQNAFSYARAGGCTVIDETNFTSAVLLDQISEILENPENAQVMSANARKFAKLDASSVIAEAIMKIVRKHYKIKDKN